MFRPRQPHSRCHYKRNSGSTPAGMNNPHIGGPAGRQAPGDSPATSAVAAMVSGRTLPLEGPRSRPSRGREPAIKAKELEARSAGGIDGVVGGETFSGCHHLSTDDGSHLPTGRSPLKSSRTGEHRPPRGGVVPERGQDNPRTRTPPQQRATSWAVPRCARRNSHPYGKQIAALHLAVGGGIGSCARAS